MELNSGEDLRKRIVDIALEEWKNWDFGKIKETQTAAVKFLKRYWKHSVGVDVPEAKLQDSKWQEDHPWSAAFISFVMRTAVPDGFIGRSYHSLYICDAIEATKKRDPSRFWAYKIDEAKPELGDLVCRDRPEKGVKSSCDGTNFENVCTLKGDRRRKSHADIVVDLDNSKHRIKVIGGNVEDNVDVKWIQLTPEGFLPKVLEPGCAYFAILKPPGGRPIPNIGFNSSTSIFTLPERLLTAVRQGLVSAQVAFAILSGQRDVNTLTNMLFFSRHQELPAGYKIKSNENRLAEQWREMRDNVISPLVQRLTRVGIPSSPASPVPLTLNVRSAVLLSLLDKIRTTPRTYVLPRTKSVVIDGYERAEPRGDVWCQQAGVSIDEGALARVVASEVGTMPPQYMLAVVEATMNDARAKKISVFQLVTMKGLKLKGGKTPKSAGYFGRQSGRWCSSINDPNRQHLEAVRVAMTASERLIAGEGRRWVDGKVMDGGSQGGKKLTNDAESIVEKWGNEGWEWIGHVYESDGKTLLLDPYRLMVFRFAGRGKANIRQGIEAIHDGRRRWNVKVDRIA